MLDVGQYLAAIGYQGPLDPSSTVLMTGRRLMRHEVGREVSRMVIDQGEYEKLTKLIVDPELTDAERAERIRELQP